MKKFIWCLRLYNFHQDMTWFSLLWASWAINQFCPCYYISPGVVDRVWQISQMNSSSAKPSDMLLFILMQVFISLSNVPPLQVFFHFSAWWWNLLKRHGPECKAVYIQGIPGCLLLSSWSRRQILMGLFGSPGDVIGAGGCVPSPPSRSCCANMNIRIQLADVDPEPRPGSFPAQIGPAALIRTRRSLWQIILFYQRKAKSPFSNETEFIPWGGMI